MASKPLTKNSTATFPYLHGFSESEQDRLRRQADLMEPYVYKEVDFTDAKSLLEVGMGVGAQTEILLRRFPHLHITGIDLNDRQLQCAQKHLQTLPFAAGRYNIHKMDASRLSFEKGKFDAAFICFMLEHVSDPNRVLGEIKRVLRSGSPIVITEVFNTSFFLAPYSPNTWKYWMAFNDFQYEHAGDPFVGGKLGNLLLQNGYSNIDIKPVVWHWDNRNPEKRKKAVEFWTELLESAAESLISSKYITPELLTAARKELEQVAHDPNAVFFFSWIQARATV